MKKGYRSFTIIRIKSNSKGKKTKEGGRYISQTPSGAAKKAFNQECKSSKIRGQCTLLIILRETTQGSKKKLYRYYMKRIKLAKPIILEKDGNKIKIQYKTKAIKMKKVNPQKLKKRLIKKGGGMGMDMDMDDDMDDEGIFTGFYNIIGHNAILYTDYFVLPEEKDESWIIKQILKQHKKEFKKAGIRNIRVEIFDTMFYPREEGMKSIKEALDIQLPIMREEMAKLDKHELQQRQRNAFDMSALADLLDTM
jgi:hypothetical protein